MRTCLQNRFRLSRERVLLSLLQGPYSLRLQRLDFFFIAQSRAMFGTLALLTTVGPSSLQSSYAECGRARRTWRSRPHCIWTQIWELKKYREIRLVFFSWCSCIFPRKKLVKIISLAKFWQNLRIFCKKSENED